MIYDLTLKGTIDVYKRQAIGKSYFVGFRPKRVVGVTEDVSSLFTFAYGEVWVPYYTKDPAWGSEGLRGGFEAMVLCKRCV